MKKFLLFFVLIFCVIRLAAQETFPVEGIRDKRNFTYAFTNATLVVAPGKTLQNATLIVRNGKIAASGTNIQVPKEAIVRNLNGMYVYPAFIDVFSNYGLPQVQPGKKEGRRPQYERQRTGAYAWNDALKVDYRAASEVNPDGNTAKDWRALGFGAVATHRMDGIARGTAALITLGEGTANEELLKPEVSANFSFERGTSTQEYPRSLMGAIALLRQTYYDAQWYSKARPKDVNLSLEEWNRQQNLPQVFAADDKLDILRAARLGEEFGITYIIKGGGDEYERVNEIKQTGSKLIIPLKFPDPFDVEDAFDAIELSLEQLRQWEMAPFNAAILEKNNIPFAITAHGLQNPANEFIKNLRLAVKNGMGETQALRALTTYPAELLQVQDLIGSLENEKFANFFIASGNIFTEDAVIYENWVQGKKYVVNQMVEPGIAGNYILNVNGLQGLQLVVEEKKSGFKVLVEKANGVDIGGKSSFENGFLTLNFPNPDTDSIGYYRLTGFTKTIDSARQTQQITGRGMDPNGNWINWSATRTGTATAPLNGQAEKSSQTAEVPQLPSLLYPNREYGWQELPKQQDIIIRNATVWTNEADGILERTDVLVSNGKIQAVGKNLTKSGALEIDGTGKHLTSGIIDEHSHIAISRGVNEGTQSVTSEVRIGDVVNSDDINIYRQLAGGVTVAHLLHGSANVIGGQSQLIKLRWGLTPEQMKFEGAERFIKFALGENVKQSNWGDHQTVRYPQTRMGVEQAIADPFARAKEYKQEWQTYNSLKGRAKADASAPRKDLELEALADILDKKLFITCHSYVQSEISMLMDVADKYGFKINTFTHILEGYKVADKMEEHGAAASTFADWWAYKYEVVDAIPYNAVLMQQAGVLVALNSDDAEMGRRLNQEAGKIVKYGGATEEEAWKMVTLNPAKMLHVENRVGSIKTGKDADLVLWSANPLSVEARAEKTLVDGVLYYDEARDRQQREWISAERARIISLMLDAKNNKKQKTRPVEKIEERHWHCDDLH